MLTALLEGTIRTLVEATPPNKGVFNMVLDPLLDTIDYQSFASAYRQVLPASDSVATAIVRPSDNVPR